jgi:hypothetical protein
LEVTVVRIHWKVQETLAHSPTRGLGTCASTAHTHAEAL